MARGFISGLVQGTALGAGALVVLSLIAPPPSGMVAPPPVDIPARLPDAAGVIPDAPPDQPAQTAAAPDPTGAPLAPVIDMPAGSEFGRGTNASPRLPELAEPTVQALSPSPAPQAPASVVAPAADTEPRSRLQSDAARLPGTEGFGGPVQPAPSGIALPDIAAAPEPGFATDQPQAPALATSAGAPPEFPDLPIRLDEEAPDMTPEAAEFTATQTAEPAAPVADAPPPDQPQVVIESAPTPPALPADQPATAPREGAGNPRPAARTGQSFDIDLSLPPALSDMQITGEN